MDSTAIKSGAAPASPVPPAAEPMPSLKQDGASMPYRILQFCASLRITVVLFALSFILVFYGTWAQKEESNWTVVSEYFRTDVVWIRLRVLFFFFADIPPNLAIPYPSGWLLGGMLLVNLLAAHAIRFQVSWKRSGILLIHAGIILMMLGELVAGLFAIEGRMPIVEGYAADYVEHDRQTELAITTRVDANKDEEVIVPGSKLMEGQSIQTDYLPFGVEVLKYMINAEFFPARPDLANFATTGIGLKQVAAARGETVGVDAEQRIEFAAAYVALTRRDNGAPLGAYLVSSYHTFLNYKPDQIEVDGKEYALRLRPKRSFRDYTVFLKKLTHDVYPGTKKPKDFRSAVRLTDTKNGDDLQVDIYMNHPLRYRGETFYQASLHHMTTGTVLQVVRNPGWQMPYWSCGIVTIGLLIHFGIMLVKFVSSRSALTPVHAGIGGSGMGVRTPQGQKPRLPRGGSHA